MFINKRSLIATILLGYMLLPSISVFSQGSMSDYITSYGIDIKTSSSIETDYPSWAKPNLKEDNKDLSYRVNEILPYEQDRKNDAYLIYPKHGIIVPIVKPNTQDMSLIEGGQKFDHFPYFQQGALHYYGDAPSQGMGNMVIAAHSSYYKKDLGRYKTAFQALIVTKPGEHIRYYEKNENGAYDLYEYEVVISKETSKYDVSILKQNTDEQTITTYGCYPIGTTDGRWYNQAKLIATSKNYSTLSNSLNTKDKVLPTHEAAPIKETSLITPTTEVKTEVKKNGIKDGTTKSSPSSLKKPLVLLGKQTTKKTTVALPPVKITSKNTPMIAKTYTPKKSSHTISSSSSKNKLLQKKQLLAMIATYNYHVAMVNSWGGANTTNRNTIFGYINNLKKEIQSLYSIIVYIK